MRRLAIAAALVPIGLLTMLRPFVGHSHWDMVEWVPFTGTVVMVNVVENVLLFVPFGVAVGWPGGRRGRVGALIAGAVVSTLVEVYQVYCHSAFPGATDVVANAAGAALGAALVPAVRGAVARHRATAARPHGVE